MVCAATEPAAEVDRAAVVEIVVEAQVVVDIVVEAQVVVEIVVEIVVDVVVGAHAAALAML